VPGFLGKIKVPIREASIAWSRYASVLSSYALCLGFLLPNDFEHLNI